MGIAIGSYAGTSHLVDHWNAAKKLPAPDAATQKKRFMERHGVATEEEFKICVKMLRAERRFQEAIDPEDKINYRKEAQEYRWFLERLIRFRVSKKTK